MLNYKVEIEELTTLVAREGGSDLHISAYRSPIMRVDGNLKQIPNHPTYSSEDSVNMLFQLINEELKERFLKAKELDFSYSTKSGIRFRGNAYFQKGFVSIALRLIPSKISTLEELHLPPILRDFALRKQGFFLCVGPVGQGKSTTLASMVNLINQNSSEHIITIEDPMEYIFKEEKSIIDQREIPYDSNSFRNALKSMFRQDINVAMIGEMRDIETISAAVTAAETGHLILSTLHTNNAAQTIDRIIDSFPASQQGQIKIQLASTLIGIFSQRLIPRTKGGLIPAYELLINNSATSNLIREGKTQEINMVIETNAELGMIDMNHSLVRLVGQGDITPEMAYKHSLSPKTLQKLL
jgi:twitching motility protein PilT